jgi:hypothetical protein
MIVAREFEMQNAAQKADEIRQMHERTR